MIHENKQEQQLSVSNLKLPYVEGLVNWIEPDVWNSMSPVEQRHFLAEKKLEHLYKSSEVARLSEAQKGIEKKTEKQETIQLPEKYQEEYKNLHPTEQRVTDGSAKAQLNVETGTNFNSPSTKNKPRFIGYQPDDQSITNYKMLKRGSASKASTWLAYVIQKWFEMVMQLSQ